MTWSVTNIGTASAANPSIASVTVPAGACIQVGSVNPVGGVGNGIGAMHDSVSNLYLTVTMAVTPGNNPGVLAQGFQTNYYCANCLALSAGSITLTTGGTTDITAFYATGGVAANIVDQAVTHTTTGSGVQPPSNTSGTPSVAGELFVGCISGSNAASQPAITQDNAHGWATPFNNIGDATNAQEIGGGNQVNSGTGTIIYNPTLSVVSGGNDSIVYGLKPSGTPLTGFTQDGVTQGAWTSGTTFTAPNLTTANAGDVIVAFVHIQGATTISVSSLSTTGITWNSSARKKVSIATGKEFELWYGTATAALSNATTTVTLSGTPTGAQALIFGITGANTFSITDVNASLPASATGTASAPSVTGVSTTNANDMIIACCVADSSPTGDQSNPTGYTTICSFLTETGTEGSETAISKVVTATQSSISVTFGQVTPAGVTWAMIVDAVTQSPAATGSPFPGFGPVVRDFRTIMA